MATTKTFFLTRPRGFRLQAAVEFFRGFTPGSGMAAADTDQGLTLAFGLDRSFEPVAVRLREEGEQLRATYVGTRDQDALRRQVARILGLDADEQAWWALGEREVVVGNLQRAFPGFFTACKASPYDAAVWGMIAARTGAEQAARIKIAMAKQHGAAVSLEGRVHHVFPAPAALLDIDRVPGLSAEKLERFKGVARAALAGWLDAERLRSMGEAEALAQLQTLRGVGPWSAGHILYRGAALIDGLPLTEPRVFHGAGAAYGIAPPPFDAFARLAERWRPFRTWVCVLVMRHLARVGGWNAPGLARERAAAGRRAA
jgi:DNA-3-methyladenine glycosylase II